MGGNLIVQIYNLPLVFGPVGHEQVSGRREAKMWMQLWEFCTTSAHGLFGQKTGDEMA